MTLASRAALALALLAAASCKSDPPKKSGFAFAPASATQKPEHACTFGLDQSCNDDPLVSSKRGACNQDGTCSCNPGYSQSPTTGKCK